MNPGPGPLPAPLRVLPREVSRAARGAEGPWGSQRGGTDSLQGGPGDFGGGQGHQAKCPPLPLSGLQLPELVVLCHLLLPGKRGYHPPTPPLKFLLLCEQTELG